MTVYVVVRCGTDKDQCEDAVLVGDTLICEGEATLNTPTSGAICIADGVGGNAGGHFASAFVSDQIKNFEFDSDKTKLQQLLTDVNSALIIEGTANSFPTAATTLTGIIFTESQNNLVHIGNTRAYVLQGKFLKQLTTDHTVYNRLLKMGRIEEAAQSKRNEITNCFGGGNASLLDSLIITDMQEFNTILLTSDGVHDYVGVDDLECLLSTESLSVQTCINIVQAALKAGSKDDVSAVIVQK